MENIILNKGIIKINDIPSTFIHNKPIIFWDTCSLLYFNSIINRRAYKEFKVDKNLTDLILNEEVYSVTSILVYQEFNKHHEDLKNKDIDLELSLANAMKEYGEIIGGEDKEQLLEGISAFKLASVMDTMVSIIWEHTYVIDDDISFLQKAHNRVLSDTPPSGKGQEYKDCYIWETFLAFCDNVTNKNQAYFVTENSDDYCGKKNKTPYSGIQNEVESYKCYIEISKYRLWVDLAHKLGIIK